MAIIRRRRRVGAAVGRSWDSDAAAGGTCRAVAVAVTVAAAAGTTRHSSDRRWQTRRPPGRSWNQCRRPRPPCRWAGRGTDIHTVWHWNWHSPYHDHHHHQSGRHAHYHHHGRAYHYLPHPPLAVPCVHDGPIILTMTMTMDADRTAADIVFADHDRLVQAMLMLTLIMTAHRHRRRASSACWAIGGTWTAT